MRTCVLVVAVLTASLGISAPPQREIPAVASQRIAREVRHELLMLPYYGVFDYIDGTVSGYDVTLTGYVTTIAHPGLKGDAEAAVKHIEGVQKVINKIEELPPSPMDDGVRTQLYRAIYGFPALEKYAMPAVKPIRIIVKNGHVTLEGVVDSENDKNMVGVRANTVPGVFSVTNNLKVASS